MNHSATNKNLTPNYIITAISCISIEYLVENYNQIDIICKTITPVFGTERYFNSPEALDDALNKIIKLNNSFVTPNFYPSVLNIVPSILHNSFGLNTFITDMHIRFDMKFTKEFTEEQFASITLLLLLTLNKNDLHVKALEDLISTKLTSPDIVKMTLYVLDNFSIQKNLDSIFPLLKSKLTSYQAHSDYLKILKSYLEAKPSKIINISI